MHPCYIVIVKWICVFNCMKQQAEQSSDCTTTAVRPKKYQDQEPCALGKLTDHLEAMLEFTIEIVVYCSST